ncbi:hypothetical protein LOTGIDRAFT_170260 [Lottia gigantea]|uniref:EGF-like domain-containing protein n=1 Tax=Lottia gigantea TaxID=225164 RepID=V3ZDU1_LOTGI|nr:hypothetical protein LOTGIDRAFT_170260 [Lottia gigantea]ESO82217.1 hypothetical protein LOTGIDRAFT_170260 [Lottia gigantea]
MKLFFGIVLMNLGLVAVDCGQRFWRMKECDHKRFQLGDTPELKSKTKYHCVKMCQDEAECLTIFFDGTHGRCYKFDKLPKSTCHNLVEYYSGKNHEFLYKGIQCKNGGTASEDKLNCQCVNDWSGRFCEIPKDSNEEDEKEDAY